MVSTQVRDGTHTRIAMNRKEHYGREREHVWELWERERKRKKESYSYYERKRESYSYYKRGRKRTWLRHTYIVLYFI